MELSQAAAGRAVLDFWQEADFSELRSHSNCIVRSNDARTLWGLAESKHTEYPVVLGRVELVARNLAERVRELQTRRRSVDLLLSPIDGTGQGAKNARELEFDG